MPFEGLGFSSEDPQEPSPFGNPRPAFQQPQLPQPGFGGFRQAAPEEDAGKNMLTPLDAHDRTTELLTNTAIPEPLSNDTHIPTPMAPRQIGPSVTDIAGAKLAAQIPRGFSAPRSGIGAGVNTQMRMQGLAPAGGFSGMRAPSLNGISTGNVARQWGQTPSGPQVTGSATGLGTSSGPAQRAAGMPTVSAPRPAGQ